jgi:hypothetical protein
VKSAWQRFLAEPPQCGHAVQVYGDVAELAESVAAFLAAGIEAGEPALVAAGVEHQIVFTNQLADLGWSADQLVRDGLLVTADAQELTNVIVDDGRPQRDTFRRVVGGLLDRAQAAANGQRLRAFGELVDVLVARGLADAALELEGLWNELLAERDVTLLCGYRVDVFDHEQQAALLPGVCRTHSHVLPAHDVDALERAVSHALEDALGPSRKRDVYYIVGDRRRGERIPVAQDALMWVTANLPSVAPAVLARAREHYRVLRSA